MRSIACICVTWPDYGLDGFACVLSCNVRMQRNPRLHQQSPYCQPPCAETSLLHKFDPSAHVLCMTDLLHERIRQPTQPQRWLFHRYDATCTLHATVMIITMLLQVLRHTHIAQVRGPGPVLRLWQV